jgi:hypothetical protein
MDTKLINSQLISRKDVRVWFFAGGKEYVGPALMVADNGLVFHAKAELPKGADPLTMMDQLCGQLKNQTVQAELQSPKVKIETRLRLESATSASMKSFTIALTATWAAAPPDPRSLKTLLEPTVTQVPKRR